MAQMMGQKVMKVLKRISLMAPLLVGLLIISSCDFTSGLNRDILVAQDYVESQNYEKAAEAYERLLKQNPAKFIRTKIHYQLAEIYYLYLNQETRALIHYNYIVENDDDPRNQVRSLEKIAEINFSFNKNYKEAIKAYSTLLNFHPRLQSGDFYDFRVAEAYYEDNNLDKADILFSRIALNTNHQFHIESFYYQGLIRFYQQKWDAAVERWLQYIKREKRKDLIVKTKFLIANAYESGEKLKEAYNIYYSLVDDHPNPQMIKDRLKALYARRVARKR
jgi:tetratricopeptide (TPR) repeat protein